ncbi:MAG: HAD hydrolase-like protein [Nanopusillaceae archaeon]
MIALDFDGTLVDSYTIIPIIYKRFQEEFNLYEGFVDAMLMLEDIWDFFGIFERYKWLKYIFKDNEEIFSRYWKMREENQIILPGTLEFLNDLVRNEDLYLVTSIDDTEEIKKNRIRKSKLDRYFKDIIIYGTKDFPDIDKAIDYLKDIEKNLIYIDDKNTNLFKLINKNIKLIKRIYYPPFPLKLAWRYPEIRLKAVTNLNEIKNLF